MSASPFFARIRAQVLQLTAAIPRGRVCTYQSLGEHLDVAPRHVAYILSRLDDAETLDLPWHRVVGADAGLRRPRPGAHGASQADLLRDEGVPVGNHRVEPDFARVFIAAHELHSGLPRQTRPPDAPTARPARAKRLGTR